MMIDPPPVNPVANLLLKFTQLNWALVAGIMVLVGLGTIALYSAAGGSFHPFASSQIQKLIAGFLVMFTVALIHPSTWKWLSMPLFIAALALLGLVMILGSEGMGAKRWLEIGPYRFQPSELTKFALVLVLASYYDRLDPRLVSRPLWLVLPILLILAPATLILWQPDLGTALILTMSGMIVMFLAGISLAYFLALVGGSIAAISLILISRGRDWQILRDYQYARIDSFLDPTLDPLGAGYHAIQAKIALGSGGIHGRGFLNGTQGQLRFLPEQHTDFIFTTLAEEFGLVWSLLILVIYVIILLMCMLIALNARDRFQSLVAMSVAGVFFLYFAINLAMVTGLAPVVGVPLPLISYGGTAAVMQLFAFGLVLAISIENARTARTRDGFTV